MRQLSKGQAARERAEGGTSAANYRRPQVLVGPWALEMKDDRPPAEAADEEWCRGVEREVRVNHVAPLGGSLSCAPEGQQPKRERRAWSGHRRDLRGGVFGRTDHDADCAWQVREERTVVAVKAA